MEEIKDINLRYITFDKAYNRNAKYFPLLNSKSIEESKNVANNDNSSMFLEDVSDKLRFDALPEKLKNKYNEENDIIILLAFNFSVSEFAQKFQEFVKAFDTKEEYMYNNEKIASLLLTFSGEEYLGLSVFSEIFEILGLMPKDSLSSKSDKINSENRRIILNVISSIFDNLCEEG